MTVSFAEEKGNMVIFVHDGSKTYRVPQNILQVAVKYSHRKQIEAYVKANFKNIKASASIKVQKKRYKPKGSAVDAYFFEVDVEVDAFYDDL